MQYKVILPNLVRLKISIINNALKTLNYSCNEKKLNNSQYIIYISPLTMKNLIDEKWMKIIHETHLLLRALIIREFMH